MSLNALSPSLQQSTEWRFIDDGYNRQYSNVFSYIPIHMHPYLCEYIKKTLSHKCTDEIIGCACVRMVHNNITTHVYFHFQFMCARSITRRIIAATTTNTTSNGSSFVPCMWMRLWCIHRLTCLKYLYVYSYIHT